MNSIVIELPKLLPISLTILLFLIACGSQTETSAGLLPKAGVVPNWTLTEKARIYKRDNLFDMVDGQADAFFVY